MISSEPSDESLMEKYQSGDAQAFDALYTRHSGKVLGFLLQQLRNRPRAEEALQGSFLKLHRFRHQYDSSQPFGPWFFTLIKNTLLDLERSEKRNPARPEKEEPTERLNLLLAPGTSVETGQTEGLLSQLEPQQREILELRYLQELSFESIASRLGLSAASVRQRVSRAVRRLRDLTQKSPSEGTPHGT